jgi:hypothetical protein
MQASTSAFHVYIFRLTHFFRYAVLGVDVLAPLVSCGKTFSWTNFALLLVSSYDQVSFPCPCMLLRRIVDVLWWLRSYIISANV